MFNLVDPVDIFYLLYRDPHVPIWVPFLQATLMLKSWQQGHPKMWKVKLRRISRIQFPVLCTGSCFFSPEKFHTASHSFGSPSSAWASEMSSSLKVPQKPLISILDALSFRNRNITKLLPYWHGGTSGTHVMKVNIFICTLYFNIWNLIQAILTLIWGGVWRVGCQGFYS